ncbi:MAG: energy transducer TonB family protein [Fermentimonas sp.]|jgi:TonB family protein
MNKITKEKIIGLIGTAIFAVLLFLLLIFSYFKRPTPPDELEGIPVMFGNVDDAFGFTEPPMEQITETPVEELPIPEITPDKPLITQTTQPTIDVEAQDEERKKQEEKLAEERRKAEEAERKRREEEARKREIDKGVSGLFGDNQGDRGNTEGSGTQGVNTGNSTQGSPTGTGGIGSYNLGGRSLGKGGLIKPSYNADDYGTIVINITVDPSGNVIFAEIGRGTNTPNYKLRDEALRAARNTKFNAINSPNNQTGTITYKFNLN